MNDVDEAIFCWRVSVGDRRRKVCSHNCVVLLVMWVGILATWSSSARATLAADVRLYQDQIFLLSLPWGQLSVVQSGGSGRAGPRELPRGGELTPGSLGIFRASNCVQ